MGKIEFVKAVGTGNDFVIVDNRQDKLNSDIPDFSEFAKHICRRKLSIGADGLLVLEDSGSGDFKMRIFNPDGSEVAMCGNGARCAAVYAASKGWCGGNAVIETGAGKIEAVISENRVKLKMSDPRDIVLSRDIGIGKNLIKTHSINTGVPHVVHFIKQMENYPVKEVGSKIRYHKLFQPEGTNVNFVKITEDRRLIVRTYERGVEDETNACGTGSVASGIIAHLIHGISSPVDAMTASGDTLMIHFEEKNKRIVNVYLEGPANIVYEGNITL